MGPKKKAEPFQAAPFAQRQIPPPALRWPGAVQGSLQPRMAAPRPMVTQPPPVFWPRSAQAVQPRSLPGVIQRADLGNAKPVAEYSRFEIINALARETTSKARFDLASVWILAQGVPFDERDGELADLLRAADRTPVLVAPMPLPLPGAPAPPQPPQQSAQDVLMNGQRRLQSWLQFCQESNIPPEPYNRQKHYGNTPTPNDRIFFGAQPGDVVDHDPPLVVRYYRGDPTTGEKPGYQMSSPERALSAQDRTRMRLHSKQDSDRQADEMSKYSKQMKLNYYHDWARFYGPLHPDIQPSEF